MKKTCTAVVLAMMVATAAHAQPGKHLALGVGVGIHDYTDGGFRTRSASIIPEYHLGLTPHSDREGLSFGLKGGIGVTRPEREEFIGGFETTTGKLRLVPVMVGAGPSYRSGPLRVGLGVVVGPSFNDFSVNDAGRAAYRDRLGVTLNSIHVRNSFAARPDVSVWYNLSDLVGLHGSVSYTINRPIVETTVNGVQTQERWTTDHWSYHAGLAFGIF